MPMKPTQVKDLGHAREILDGLRARCALGAGGTNEDMREFTEALSAVMEALTTLEMQTGNVCDDSGTAATLPETVASSPESSRHSPSTVTHADEAGYSEEASRDDDDDRWHYEVASRLHRKRHVDGPRETYDDDYIDETDFSQGLCGYEEGFYPSVCDTIEESPPVSRKTVSNSPFGSPLTVRTKGAISTASEESQCFFCLKNNGGGENCCRGTRFCI